MLTSGLDVLSWCADHVSVFGWTGIFLLAWRVRGWLDNYMTAQQESYKQVARTLSTVEDAKKVAMDSFEKAIKEGADKAFLLQEKVEANSSKLDNIAGNHLAHMEKDMREMNGKQDEVIKLLFSVDKNISILVDRTERK